MKILAVDTATPSCSVAVVDNESLLAEVSIVSTQTHSKHLIELIKQVNLLSGLTMADLDGYAVSRGPGSFTGLRIGISTVKGLVAASDKPVVGVSSLEALASQCFASSYLICPLIDARKGEVYYSSYRMKGGSLIQIDKEQVNPVVEIIKRLTEPSVFVGNGSLLYQEDIKREMGNLAHFAPVSQNIIRAATIAHLGMKRFEIGETDDAASLVPHYIRRSDAEINLAKKGQKIKKIKSSRISGL
jgi:tRNA threonylcarbamoyladenosine biosynthesis protein TsaB